MAETTFASPRTFRIWLYAVGHSTLLLRSLKEKDVPTRIDVIFKPVSHMILPTTLDGIDVRVVSPADVSRELADVVRLYDSTSKIYALTGVHGRAWVVSGTMAWHEDEGADSDPSHFSVPRMVW